jgi:hypothetical protein
MNIKIIQTLVLLSILNSGVLLGSVNQNHSLLIIGFEQEISEESFPPFEDNDSDLVIYRTEKKANHRLNSFNCCFISLYIPFTFSRYNSIRAPPVFLS